MGKILISGFWDDDFDGDEEFDEELSKFNSYREYLHISSQIMFL